MASLAGHGAPHPPVRVSRVNAPFIPITVLPFAQSFTPPGGYPCPETTRAGVTAARPA
jgi:hypothetical protein